MKHLVTLIALCAVIGPGCKSDADKEATAAKTTEAEPAAATSSSSTEPPAPSYSPAAADELVGKLAACTSPYACEPLETLVGFGDKVSADLATIAVDPGKPKELRRIAAEGLVKIQDPTVGVKLFEAGKAEEDFIVRLDLFKAAGASGGDETFAAMVGYYLSDEARKARHTTDLLIALRAFGSEKLMGYARDNWPADKKLEVRFADLVRDEPTAGDKDALAAMLEKTTDSMARHRLASALVKVGDTGKLDILVEGLKSKSEYDRSDAANMLADVLEHVPAERKAEIVELATAARAKDKGGLTSVGYDKIIKTLGG